MRLLLFIYTYFQISFKVDGFRLMYFGISLFVFLICTLFAIDHLKNDPKKKRFYISWAVTFLCTVGFLFAGDFITCFMFFEIMSLTSCIWVFQRETPESYSAGRVYLRISVICGMVMLMGLIMLKKKTGIDFVRLFDNDMIRSNMLKGPDNDLFLPALLISIGFGAKAGVFLLHVWLPKGYTEAVDPGSAFLSAILSKTGIIGIIWTTSALGLISNEKWGNLLMIFGALTMVTGALLAVFSNNLKTTVACSSLSQMGFILTGVSAMVLEPGPVAYSGTVLHMVNHTLIKTALFLAVAVIYEKTGTYDLNKLKGYGKNMPVLKGVFGICGFSLAGSPAFSGFVSKNMMHEALDAVAKTSVTASIVSVIFTVTGGLTLCYMLKLFISLFGDKGFAAKNPEVDLGKQMFAAVPTVVVLVTGLIRNLYKLFPVHALSDCYLPWANEKTFAEIADLSLFSFATIRATLISVAVGLILYFFFVRKVIIGNNKGERVYKDIFPKWIDLEKYLYRPIFMVFLPFVCAFVARVFDKLLDLIIYFFRKKVFKPLKKKRPVAVGNGFTYGMGTVLDKITGRQKNPGKVSFVTVLALFNEQTAAMARMIERSLSLSMLLFSTGLVITLLYMLFK